MLSVIHKKAPRELNGLEDVLTGDFFGAIRYTSSFGSILYHLLSEVEFDAGQETRCKLAGMHKNQGFSIKFWPSDQYEGEIDLMIEFPDSRSLIGIEMKYNSGLSSEDQLERYARYVAKSGGYEHRYLILWAQEPDAQIVFNEKKESLRNIPGLHGFGFFSWQKAAEVLGRIEGLVGTDKIILDDLSAYLIRKGLDGFIRFPDIQLPVVNLEDTYIFQAPAERIDFSSISSNLIITSEHYVFN